MGGLEAENRRLRQRLHALTQEASRNEGILRRFHERELELLATESLPELIHALTAGLRESLGVDALGLVIADPEHDLGHLLAHAGTPAEAFPELRLTPTLEAASPLLARLERPWLGPLLAPEHTALFPHPPQDGSVALLPLSRRRERVGALILLSRDPRRFTRHHASDFLLRLASVGAVCLENAANRERILISGATDPLTALPNRRAFEKRLAEELSRGARYQQPLSCLFVDVDHFKQVNDNHGHALGDVVLQEVAERLRRHLRGCDLAARWGGEEFALLLPQTTSREAGHLAERIRLEVCGAPIATGGDARLTVSVSIGVSDLRPVARQPLPEDAGKRLLEEADRALYRAKERGRNRVEIELSQPAPRHRWLHRIGAD